MTEALGKQIIPPEDFLKTLTEADQKNLQVVVGNIREAARRENYEVHLLITSQHVLNPERRRQSGIGIVLEVFSPQIAPEIDTENGRIMFFDRYAEFLKGALEPLGGELQTIPPNTVEDEDNAFDGLVRLKPLKGSAVELLPVRRYSVQKYKTPQRYIDFVDRPSTILMSQLPKQLQENA